MSAQGLFALSLDGQLEPLDLFLGGFGLGQVGAEGGLVVIGGLVLQLRLLAQELDFLVVVLNLARVYKFAGIEPLFIGVGAQALFIGAGEKPLDLALAKAHPFDGRAGLGGQAAQGALLFLADVQRLGPLSHRAQLLVELSKAIEPIEAAVFHVSYYVCLRGSPCIGRPLERARASRWSL